ncbi:MAG: hypothetical protein ACKVWR_15105 [Acidimicrobiales bacterium]
MTDPTTPPSSRPCDLNDDKANTPEMRLTDLPVPQGEPADDNTTTQPPPRRTYLANARRTIEASNASADPIRYRQRWLADLLARAEAAEQWAQSQEASLQAAIDAMQRRETAARVARQHEQAIQRLRAAEDAEQRRLRRNARQRASYARRRDQGRADPEGRTGLHAIAIVVDPASYAAVKAEGYKRRTSIPVVLGEILTAARLPDRATPESGPRWQRTGQGRRANQHARIAIDDDAWHQLHLDAINSHYTTGRWVGLLIEHWAQPN